MGDENSLANVLQDAAPAPVAEVAPAAEAKVEQQPAPKAEEAAPGAEVKTGEAATVAPAETEEQKRIKGLEAAAAAERRKRQDAERRLAELTQTPAAPAPEGDKRPVRGDDESYEDFLKRESAWEGRQAAEALWKERKEEERKEAEAKSAQQHAEQLQARADAQVEAGRVKYTDFDKVINEGLWPFMTRTLHVALIESDHGADIGHHLGSNQAEADRISKLPEKQMLKEIGRLEERFANQQPPKDTPLPNTLTQERDARGRFATTAGAHEPTDLNQILGKPA